METLANPKKTWTNFKIYFVKAFKENKPSKNTSKDLGYSTHLQSVESRAEMFLEMQQDHNVALANLATATKADCESVSLMYKKISELTTQIASITKQLSDAHLEIARLKGKPKKGGEYLQTL